MTDLPRDSAGASAAPPPAHPAGPAALPGAPVTPRLRGRLHQFAFAFSIPAGVALVLQAQTIPARLAAAVYATSLAGMYATSAAFHRGHWSPTARRRMDQADHAMIYVLIAGTYTPFALLAFDRTWSVVVLGVVWTIAAAGIGVVIWRHRIRLVGITLYLTLGWLAALTLPWLTGRLGAVKLTLLLAGGVLYTVGAVVLDRQRPNPRPAVFGYHEVWHALTLAAGLCHYILIWLLVTAG
jgi:hemolysin III